MLKVGIYARVSTYDQNTLNMQIGAIKEYIKIREWCVEYEVAETGSGPKQNIKRDELINTARRQSIDVIIVWKLDRWWCSVK